MIEPIPDPTHEGAPDLTAPELYLNRELSLLQFFRRVLGLAAQPDMPILERLRFLTICSTIIDEFFEIRVAGLEEREQFDHARPEADGMPVPEVLRRISDLVHSVVNEQYRLLNQAVLPTLSAANVHLLPRGAWNKNQRKWVKRYFDTQVAPVLTPVGLDPAHPFPRILNKSLNMLVLLEGRDAFGRSARRAVLQVPRCLPRVLKLPADLGGGEHVFVLLSSVIHAHVEEAFPGMKVRGCHQFRVTRNADLWVDEEEVEDLLGALQDHLHDRRFGQAVRLEVVDTCPEEEISFLLEHFELTHDQLYRVDGPVNLHRAVAIYDLVDRPELKFQAFVPGLRGATGDLFAALDAGDILLHHPYESFAPVAELVRQAAQDPEVLAIKQTLYRVGSRSQLVDALIEAARSGKEVTAVVELRARFDEAANIDLATRLQQAGAHVVYGVVGYKTHAKMLLVVRREGEKIKRYVHLGTGNYHSGTARAYTDWSLLTSREAIGDDVHRIFMQLTGLGRAKTLSLLFQAPFTLQQRLVDLIAFEAKEARAGRPARIVIKINSLADPAMIQALYQASQAGVSIDLIVRGMCCLRPGVPGFSDNIRVRSVVGRFLEHTRVFWFHSAGEDKVYLASADLMGRNLYRRVETCFPVLDLKLKKRVIDEGLKRYLDDTEGAWQLNADGTYKPCSGTGPLPRSAQGELLVLLAER
jgi:polyphosphate kinase